MPTPVQYHPHVEHPDVQPDTGVSVGDSGRRDELGRPIPEQVTWVTVYCLYCGQPFPLGELRDCRLRPVGAPTPPEVQVPADRRRR